MKRCTVLIAHVPTRYDMLKKAVQSVVDQEEPCDCLIALDTKFTGQFRIGGAAETRNRGLKAVETEWTAFLDDDDWLYPQHVSHCLKLADETGADLVYPWWDGANESLFRVPDEHGQIRTPEGLKFGPQLKHFLMGDYIWQQGHDGSNYVPITVVVKTELLREVGGFPIPGTEEWPERNSEDHGLWIRLLRAGAKFEHLPERTWRYVLHDNHLSY